MATSAAGITDEVSAVLNPAPPTAPVPDRPADGATAAKWTAYVVALGASPDVAEETRHWDGDAQDYVTVPPLTRAELVELADRLGG